MKKLIRGDGKEVGKDFFFLLLICAYTVSVSLHTLAFLYVMLFVTSFAVLLYCHKLSSPIVKVIVFAFFYAWVGFDERCYIFKNISNYNRYFYCLITISMGVYLYRRWNGDIKSKNSRHFLATAVVEFIFWGFAILDNIETATGSISGTIILAVIFFIWSTELVDASLYLLGLIVVKVKMTNASKQDYRRVWLIVFLILVVGGGLFSSLFYPGVITADIVGIHNAAMNIGDAASRTDIHSFAYTCFEKIVFSIWDNYYFLTWILMVAFSAAWACFMTNICRLGLNRKIAYIVTFAWLLVPSNLYMLIAIWKDIPFTISMIIVANMLMKISVYEDKLRVKKRDYVVLAIGIIGVALFRSNGLFVLTVMIAVSMFYALKYKKRAFFLIFKSVAIAGIVILIIKIPIYQALKVERTPSGFAAIPLVDGIWENIVYGENVPDEVVAVIEDDILPVSEFENSYVEGYTNIYCFPNGFKSIEFDNVKDAWLTCLKTNPFITLIARLKKTYNLWSVFPSREIPIDTNYVAEIVDSKDLNYLDVPFFDMLRHIFRICYSDGWLYGNLCYIFARGGWNIFLWIVLGLFLKKRRMGNQKIIIVPAIANTIALFLACCYQDYRYMYPMFVLTVLYMLYVFQACAMQ